ncbi:protein of unknown function [Pseudodesulfovibrio profundus]|uniref:Uncharacterized protein n=1 Tax=Pseudodesulfovibrio profundus TaxID=57320 RepID=A0A2C8F3M0_9BACT|nr:protein of unknown function [Pseudodesulfovibrio profundus]
MITRMIVNPLLLLKSLARAR